MNILRDIQNYLRFSFNSIRCSLTSFITTLIVGIAIYKFKFSGISRNLLFIVLVIDAVICIFTGITSILLSIQRIWDTIHNHYIGKKMHKNLVDHSIKVVKVVSGEMYLRSDVFKLYKNYPKPEFLVADNSAKYLVSLDIIEERSYMSAPNLEKAYILTDFGMDICEKIFNDR